MTLSNHINYVWVLSIGFVVRSCRSVMRTANLYTDEISPRHCTPLCD